MAQPRILLVVLAGGAGGRLERLTEDRAKPAVPYGGRYRLIDFALSNALHSGISDVWVLLQYHPVSLADHLANGRPWDLDRTTGGLLVVPPHRGTEKEGWHQGTADGLWRHSEQIRDFGADALVVVSADAVYQLDYEEVVREHLKSDVAATMVTTEVSPDDAGRYGVVQVRNGAVTDYAYKPEQPFGALISNEVFVFHPTTVTELLDELAAEADEDGLQDLGTALLPHLVADGKVREHRFSGYWRDVGTVEAYWNSHQDLLEDPPEIRLDDPRWPLRTRGGEVGPTRLLRGSEVADSLVSGGTRIAGTVARSVLGPGVRIEHGAQVIDSVVLPGTIVRSGAVVERAVIDERADIGKGARVGGPASGSADESGGVTLIGCGAQIGSEQEVKAGDRYPET